MSSINVNVSYGFFSRELKYYEYKEFYSGIVRASVKPTDITPLKKMNMLKIYMIENKISRN